MSHLSEALFSEAMRRDPYPAYEQIRKVSPVLHEPRSGLWMIFDYEGVKRALNDPETRISLLAMGRISVSGRPWPGWRPE